MNKREMERENERRGVGGGGVGGREGGSVVATTYMYVTHTLPFGGAPTATISAAVAADRIAAPLLVANVALIRHSCSGSAPDVAPLINSAVDSPTPENMPIARLENNIEIIKKKTAELDMFRRYGTCVTQDLYMIQYTEDKHHD